MRAIEKWGRTTLNPQQPRELSVSVVIYRDYESPCRLLRTLDAYRNPQIDLSVYIVDNSAWPEDWLPQSGRDNFVQYAESFPYVAYINAGANLGFGKAHNAVLEQVNSDYHAFVNPDVSFESDAFGPLVSYLESDCNAAVVIPRLLDEQGRIQPVYRHEVTLIDALNRTLLGGKMRAREWWHTMQYEDYAEPFYVPFGQGSFLLGRTSLLQKLGGFDERFFLYLEDADFCRRVNELSAIAYVPDSTAVHDWARESHRNWRLTLAHARSYAEYFRKWGLKLA